MQLHWTSAKMHIPNCGQIKVKTSERLLLMHRHTVLSLCLSFPVKDAGRHIQAHSDNTLPDTHKLFFFFRPRGSHTRLVSKAFSGCNLL